MVLVSPKEEEARRSAHRRGCRTEAASSLPPRPGATSQASRGSTWRRGRGATWSSRTGACWCRIDASGRVLVVEANEEDAVAGSSSTIRKRPSCSGSSSCPTQASSTRSALRGRPLARVRVLLAPQGMGGVPPGHRGRRGRRGGHGDSRPGSAGRAPRPVAAAVRLVRRRVDPLPPLRARGRAAEPVVVEVHGGPESQRRPMWSP